MAGSLDSEKHKRSELEASRKEMSFGADNIPITSGKLMQIFWLTLFNRQLGTCQCGKPLTAQHLLCYCVSREIVEAVEAHAEVGGRIRVKDAFLLCRDRPKTVWIILGKLAEPNIRRHSICRNRSTIRPKS